MGYGTTFGILGGGHGPLCPPLPKSAYDSVMVREVEKWTGIRIRDRIATKKL